MLDRVSRQPVTQQSWQKDSVRTAVADLRTANPRADDTRLASLFAERMRVDDALLSAAAEYVVMLAVNSIQRAQAAQPTVRPEKNRAAATAQQDAVMANVREQIILLNMEMPNGKRMRWCTGAEMLKFGGAFTKIGKKVGTTKIVGQVMDEKQVRQIVGG